MLNEFHSRNDNRSSTCSNTSKSTSSSSGIRFDQPVGHEFASNILVADLAIRSTAYKPPTPPIPSTTITPPPDNMKPKRRVTFNLDDIQIKTISAYDSTISLASTTSSSSFIESSPKKKEKEEEAVVVDIIAKEQSLAFQEPPITQPTLYQPTISNNSSERISKKESYDALLKRKQYRRNQQQPTIKPGYWYPLASTRNQIIKQSLPTIRSLELTEKLINESIQREIALNPNLHFTPPSPSPSPPSNLKKEETELNVEKEGEESDDLPTTNTVTMVSSDEEEEEQSVTTTLLPPPTIVMEKDETNFTKSVYNELSKSQQLLFPFEDNLIPITSNKDVLIMSPPPSPPIEDEMEIINNEEEDELTWIDHPSLLIHSTNNTRNSRRMKRKGLFFVKILNTESLDFPIEDDDTAAYSTIHYKDIDSKSNKQTLSHSMQINHELKIEDVNPNEQITIKIHANKKKHHANNNHHSNHNSNNWYHRILPSHSTDLERYINEKDGSICQTIFTPDKFMANIESTPLDQTATLMLVNNWYKPSSESAHHTNLLHWKKNTRITREKAVGKIIIQCLYITIPLQQCKDIPQTMDEAIEALNAKRFHQTDWQSGYLSQLGGNTNCLKKRYFILTGGDLFAYQSSEIRKNQRPLYKLSIAKVKKLVCDQIVVAESNKNSDTTTSSTLLNQLDSMIESLQDESILEEQVETYSNTVENGFQLIFDNGENIQFVCDTLEERSKWIALLKVMICKLPKLPQWVIL